MHLKYLKYPNFTKKMQMYSIKVQNSKHKSNIHILKPNLLLEIQSIF